MRLCSINSTMGSSPCPFLARNVANSCSLKFPCLRIVWYCFFTAVLPSRFRNPILRNQAGPPLNFQLWVGHPRRVSSFPEVAQSASGAELSRSASPHAIRNILPGLGQGLLLGKIADEGQLEALAVHGLDSANNPQEIGRAHV